MPFAGKYDHTDPIFQSLKILDLINLYMYSVPIFLYYIASKIFQTYSLIFTVASTIHEHHTRQNTHYRAPLARCVQRSSALRCTGVKINNSLFDYISYNCSYSTYKHEARTHLSIMSDADILRILA